MEGCGGGGGGEGCVWDCFEAGKGRTRGESSKGSKNEEHGDNGKNEE
jgi:hypothetical protein